MIKSNATEIDEVAAAWLARRDSADWSETQRAEFDRWLQSSTAHRVAYLRLEAAWQRADRLVVLGAGHVSAPYPGRLSIRRSYAQALAAGVLLALLGAGWLVWRPMGTSYATAVGGLQAVPLTDGSNITLNSNSQIRVEVTAQERQIELRRGEAFFEVARDPTRPFVVMAGNSRVIAVGTKFAVRREGDDVQVIVTEGRVRVERDSRLPPRAPVALLAAGSIARSGDTGVLVQEKSLAEAETYLSWRSGFLIFRDTTLRDAAAEFNRYNTRKLIIGDPLIAGLRVGGNFRSTNVDAFVRLLETGMSVRARREGDDIILQGS